MQFKTLDEKMRKYETTNDLCVLPEMYIVARLDGRGFTKLCKNQGYKRPFDSKFAQAMIGTVKYLMENSDFKITYGYVESDEISLLFHIDEDGFDRKIRKINSTLASIASVFFSKKMGVFATFDCRVCQLPNKKVVLDYFRWRQEDSARNCLNAYCYYKLQELGGKTSKQATKLLLGKGRDYKNELLFNMGINFNDVPLWQKRGAGLFWSTIDKEGYNPLTGETVIVKRNALRIETKLPCKYEYDVFILNKLEE